MLRLMHGDTMAEVLFAITAYSVVALFTINTMKIGLQQGEASLELSQARIEISAQADALRFIHNSYLAEREYDIEGTNTYETLWNAITSNDVTSAATIPDLAVSKCSTIYGDNTIKTKAFIINTRHIDPSYPATTIIPNSGTGKLVETSLYPRVLYGTMENDNSDADYYDSGSYDSVLRAEGIWILVRRSSENALGTTADKNIPQYYDFHIYSCWYAPGSNQPSTIGTIVRLYNPLPKEGI